MSTQVLFKVEDHIFEKMLQELDKNPTTLKEYVAILVEWIGIDPHLPKSIETKILENYLITYKFRTEQCKQKLSNYYGIRSKMSQIFLEINPFLPNMKQFREIGYLVPHPDLTPQMYRVFFGKLRNKYLLHKAELIEALRHCINLLEMRLRTDVTYGDVFVVDCEGGAELIYKFNSTVIYKWFKEFYEGVFAPRLKALYIINVPAVAVPVVHFVKAIISPKLFDKIHICNLEDVQKAIPKNILPTDFGGDGYSLEKLSEILEKKFIENKELFEALDKLNLEERLKSTTELFGTFKQLDID